MSSFAEGLNRFDRKAGTFQRYQHDPSNPNSMFWVSEIYEDDLGIVWLGDNACGLTRVNCTLGTFNIFSCAIVTCIIQ